MSTLFESISFLIPKMTGLLFSFQMRRRISIIGRVRPTVRRSVAVGPSRVIFEGEKYAY